MVVMQWAKNKQGFTIVELLIVVVVVAILATITIVSFNGIQARAKVAAVQSDLSAIGKKVEMHKTLNSSYPTSAGADNVTWANLLKESAGDISDGTKKSFIMCRVSTGAFYAVIAWAPISPAAGGTMYYVSSNSTTITSTTYPGQGGYSTVSNAACATALNMTSGFGANWSQLL